MANLKHVGRIVNSNKKVLVAFRTLPGDSGSCLVIPTESLDDSYHNALINIVESSAAQAAYEFAEALDRTQFPDGSRMLPSLHVKGLMQKVSTGMVEMTPAPGTSILLSELNQMIAEQRGVTVDDLAIRPPNGDDPKKSEVQEVARVTELPESSLVDDPSKTTSSAIGVEEQVADLSPELQAKRYRSEADRLAKEAAKFRRLAEDLVPTSKPKKSKA